MRTTLRPSRDTTRAPAPELVIPRTPRSVPTHTTMHTRRISVWAYVAGLLLLPTVMVAGFVSADMWANAEKSTTAPAALAGTPSAESGAEAPGSPADVRGSMTIQQVVDAFPPITAARILATLGAPLDTPTSTQLKTLVEKGNSMDIPTLRTWLQEQGSQ